MAGIFGRLAEKNVKIDEIPDNPNFIPDNTYKCCVVGAEEKLTQNEDKNGLTIEWQIVEGDFTSAFPFKHWLQIPLDDQPDEYYSSPEVMKMMSYVKKLYLGLGFTEDELATVETQDLITREAYVTVKNRQNKKNPEYTNLNVTGVRSIEDGDNEGDTGGESYDPFAKPSGPQF